MSDTQRAVAICNCGAEGSIADITDHIARMKARPHNQDNDYHGLESTQRGEGVDGTTIIPHIGRANDGVPCPSPGCALTGDHAVGVEMPEDMTRRLKNRVASRPHRQHCACNSELSALRQRAEQAVEAGQEDIDPVAITYLDGDGFEGYYQCATCGGPIDPNKPESFFGEPPASFHTAPCRMSAATWNAVLRAKRSETRLAQTSAENERLIGQVHALLPYTRHFPSCDQIVISDHCACGLAQARRPPRDA